ncbi:hypothetical protein HZH68_001238 [Vespula germanica]|uniref:Uncharacterized protein n=1 Tax=Vespula germanica TaxID=30212 RepID=A0A834NV28_VESGE|nr:hypothetical protein HZH68_001238 [Vespula germanica]
MGKQERNEKNNKKDKRSRTKYQSLFEVEREENKATVTIVKENAECEKNHKPKLKSESCEKLIPVVSLVVFTIVYLRKHSTSKRLEKDETLHLHLVLVEKRR